MKIGITVIAVIALMLVASCATGQAKGGVPGKGGDSEPTTQCSDGVDNDGDGACDVNGCTIGKGRNKQTLSADVDCTSSSDDNEAPECVPSAEMCDGVDNDCDGAIDEDNVCVVCGDGVIGGSEECDDGNTVAGDGCSSTCTIESPQEDFCIDSDGDNKYLFGNVTGFNGTSYSYVDTCLSDTTLVENLCNGAEPSSKTYNCGEVNASSVCSQGRCTV